MIATTNEKTFKVHQEGKGLTYDKTAINWFFKCEVDLTVTDAVECRMSAPLYYGAKVTAQKS